MPCVAEAESMRVSIQETDHRCTVGQQFAKNPTSCDPAISLPGYAGHRHTLTRGWKGLGQTMFNVALSLVTERWRVSGVLHWNR